MADPREIQILDHIVTDLTAITTDNGYAVNIGDVHQPKTIDDYNRPPPGNYDVQVVIGDPSRMESEYYGVIRWKLPLNIECVIRPSDSNTTPIQKLASIFAAAVVQCVMADPQHGALALDTHEMGKIWDDADDGAQICNVVFEIDYEHDINDPTTLGGA